LRLIERAAKYPHGGVIVGKDQASDGIILLDVFPIGTIRGVILHHYYEILFTSFNGSA
jgi:hypothetical protein